MYLQMLKHIAHLLIFLFAQQLVQLNFKSCICLCSFGSSFGSIWDHLGQWTQRKWGLYGGLTICSAFARMHHDINYHFSPYKKPYELYLIQFCFRFRVQSVSPKCLDRGPVQCYSIEAHGCACTNFYKHPLVRVCSICCRLYTGIYSMCMIYDKSSQSNKAYTCNYLKCLTNWCNLSNYKEIIF